jgi:hypothetical protein
VLTTGRAVTRRCARSTTQHLGSSIVEAKKPRTLVGRVGTCFADLEEEPPHLGLPSLANVFFTRAGESHRRVSYLTRLACSASPHLPTSSSHAPATRQLPDAPRVLGFPSFADVFFTCGGEGHRRVSYLTRRSLDSRGVQCAMAVLEESDLAFWTRDTSSMRSRLLPAVGDAMRSMSASWTVAAWGLLRRTSANVPTATAKR